MIQIRPRDLWSLTLVRRTTFAILLSFFSFCPAFSQNVEPELTRAVPVGFYQAPESYTKHPVMLEQFRVVGLPARVRTIELDRGPRRIILLLDRSGSMKHSRKLGVWDWAVRLAKEFLVNLRPEDQVSLHVFGSTQIQVTAFTSDFSAVAKEIDALAPPATPDARKSTGWGTYLYDELPDLFKSFGPDCRFGDSILVVTDGGFAQGPQKVHRALAAAGVRVFLLLSSLPYPSSHSIKFGETPAVSQFRLMEFGGLSGSEFMFGGTLTSETGGDIFDPWKDVLMHPGGGFDDYSNDVLLPRAASAAYYVVKNVFRFEIQLSASVDKIKRFDIQYLNAQGKPLKDIKLVYPHYLGPSPGSP